MSVINVTMNNFDELKNGTKPLLLDFYADWCGPCQMIKPIVAEIADEYPEYAVGKVNVDEVPELAQMFSVVSIPLLVVMKDGKVAAKATGYRQKDQILELLEG